MQDSGFPQGIVLYLTQESRNPRVKHSLVKELVISSSEDLVSNPDSTTYYSCDLEHVT